MNPVNLKTFAVATSLAALMATGCAAAPDRPEKQLARAETSIELAEENGAREYGATALDRAQQHLTMALNEAEDGEYENALRYAQKAELDAELAAAETNTNKAREALVEIQESIEALRRELARHTVS